MALRHQRPATAICKTVAHQHLQRDSTLVAHAFPSDLLRICRPLEWQPIQKHCMRRFSTARACEFLSPISSACYHRRGLTTVDPSNSYAGNLNDLRKTAITDDSSGNMTKLSQIDPASADVMHNTHLRSPAMSYEKNIETLRIATAEPERAPNPSFDFSHLHSHDRMHANEKASSSSSSSADSSGTIDEEQDADVEKLRRRLLSATLPFVRELGWTTEAIAAGAEHLGESSSIHGLFQRGGIDLILFFYHDCNRRLRERMSSSSSSAGGVSAKINRAVHERLEMLGPVVDSWPQALAIMSLPQNAFGALHALGELMDDIWYTAGDRSSDFSWYTKRASLASVYCATELYMMQDTSTGFEATWSFLDRRLRDFGMLNRISNRLRNPFGRSMSDASSSSMRASTASSMSPFNVLKRCNPFSHSAKAATQHGTSSFSPSNSTSSTYPTSNIYSTGRYDTASSSTFGSAATRSGVIDGTYTSSIPPSPFIGTTTTSTTSSCRPDIFGDSSNNPAASIRNASDQIAGGNNPITVVGEAMRNVFGAQKPGNKW